MVLIVSPSKLRMITELRIDSGIEIAMMIVLRQLPRNSRIISAVRAAAITVSRITPVTAERTKTDWSESGSIRSCDGTMLATNGRMAGTPLTQLSVEEFPAI